MTTKPYFHHFNGGFAFTDDKYKYGVVNYRGDTIAPFVYEDVTAYPKNDFVILQNADKKAGVINKEGKVVIPFIYLPKHPNYYPGYSYSDYGVFMFYKSNYKDSNFVFVDMAGEELIKEASYENAWKMWAPYESRYANRYYIVEKGKKTGIYDTKQKKEIIPCEYGFLEKNEETRFGVIGAKDRKGNWGLLSLETGSVIIPFGFESAKSTFVYTKDNVATFIVSKEGKFGIMDYKGATQLSLDYYDIVKTNAEHLLIVQKNGLYGLFDIKTSDFVIPIELKSIDKYLRFEKLENDRLTRGTFLEKENRIQWEK